MTSSFLEEQLELPASNFPDSVNLLSELLKDSADIAFIEGPLVSTDCSKKLRLGLSMSNKRLDEVSQRDHGLFTDPAAHITSPIKLIVIESGEHRIKCVLEELRLRTFHAQCHDHVHQ